MPVSLVYIGCGSTSLAQFVCTMALALIFFCDALLTTRVGKTSMRKYPIEYENVEVKMDTKMD